MTTDHPPLQSYRVVAAGMDPHDARRFATEPEAHAYASHLSVVPLGAAATVSRVRQQPTHRIDGPVLYCWDAGNGVGELLITDRSDLLSPDDYAILVEQRLIELAEGSQHVVAMMQPASVSGRDAASTVLVVPGDSLTVWQVSLLFDEWDCAAHFVVDIGGGFAAAPGMTPDPKPGYVMWDPGEGSVALVFRDSDGSGLGTRELSIDPLPDYEGPRQGPELAELAQAIAEAAIGWQ